jgi:hypothetical protein
VLRQLELDMSLGDSTKEDVDGANKVAHLH